MTETTALVIWRLEWNKRQHSYEKAMILILGRWGERRSIARWFRGLTCIELWKAPTSFSRSFSAASHFILEDVLWRFVWQWIRCCAVFFFLESLSSKHHFFDEFWKLYKHMIWNFLWGLFFSQNIRWLILPRNFFVQKNSFLETMFGGDEGRAFV